MSGMIYDRTLLLYIFIKVWKILWSLRFVIGPLVLYVWCRPSHVWYNWTRDLFALQIFYKYTFYGTYIFYTFRILEDLFFYVYKFIFKKINLPRQLEPKFPSRDRTYSIYIFTLLKTNEVHLSCNFRYRHKATCTSWVSQVLLAIRSAVATITLYKSTRILFATSLWLRW